MGATFLHNLVITLFVILFTSLTISCSSTTHPDKSFMRSADSTVSKYSKVPLSPASTSKLLRELMRTPKPAIYAIAKFRKHPTIDERRILKDKGITILEPIRGKIYSARISKQFKLNDKFVADLFVAARILRARDKVATEIWNKDYKNYIATPAGKKPINYVLNRDGTLNITVRFYKLTPLANIQAIINKFSIRHKQLSDHYWVAVITAENMNNLAKEDIVAWIDAGPAPSISETDGTRAFLNVDSVQNFDVSTGTIRGIGGSGIQVGVFEEAGIDQTHDDFDSRIIVQDTNLLDGQHATAMAGIIGGSGFLSDKNDNCGNNNGGTVYQWRGIAPLVNLIEANNNFATVASKQSEYIITHGLDLSNHSYAVSYDGNYSSTNRLRDELIRGDETYMGNPIPGRLQIYSAGNHGAWPSHGGEQVGYFSLTKQMKNALLVGNFDAVNNRIKIPDEHSPQGSSLGPAYDGRIKPDLVAPGTFFNTTGYLESGCFDSSTGNVFDKHDYYKYWVTGGTSSAAASVSGVLALVLEQYVNSYGINLDTSPPLPSTLKSILINSARDIESPPWGENEDGPIQAFSGPDFVTGFGLVDAQAAVDLVANKLLLEDTINETCNSKTYRFKVNPGETNPVKVTLAWDDAPAGATTNENSKTSPKLLNDLDLLLIDPNNNTHYPWLLDQQTVNQAGEPVPDDQQSCGMDIEVLRRIQPSSAPNFVRPGHESNVNDPIEPEDLQPASRGKDHLNNVEQVVTTSIPGIWKAIVSGFNIPSGPQKFSLTGFRPVEFTVRKPPTHFEWERPHPHYWSTDFDVTSYVVEADDNKNVFFAGSRNTTDHILRYLQKYDPAGTALMYADGWELPLYGAWVSNELYTDFPWHKIRVDDHNGRVYVLFAASVPESADTYAFFLASHEQDYGELSESWSGSVKFVGESKLLNGAIDVDADGNIWTVIHKEISTASPTIGLQIKKWSKQDGHALTLPNDGLIVSAHKSKFLIAFNIKNEEQSFYLAYRQESNPGYSSPYEEPIELVVTHWNHELNLLKKSETRLPISWPTYPTGTTIRPDPEESLRPVFHDGYVDTDGTFVVGGFYYFDSLSNNNWIRWFYPVVLRYFDTLDKLYTVVADTPFTQVTQNNNPLWDRYRARVKKGPDNSTYYSIVPMQALSTPFPTRPLQHKTRGRDSILAIDYTGGKVIHKFLDSWRILDGSGAWDHGSCTYKHDYTVRDFVHIPSSTIDDDRLVVTGVDKITKTKFSRGVCIGGHPVITISYKRQTNRSSLEIDRAQLQNFNWLMMIDKVIERDSISGVPVLTMLPKAGATKCTTCDRAIREGVKLLVQPGTAEFSKQSFEHIENLISKVPPGPRFMPHLRQEFIDTLQKTKHTTKNNASVLASLLKVITAISIDRRFPPKEQYIVASGKTVQQRFTSGISLTLDDVQKPGTLSVATAAGLPALVKGYRPVWPIATYTLAFSGEISGQAEISIELNKMEPTNISPLLKLFEWDGKIYRDITTEVDLAKGVLKGKTSKLASYVILQTVANRKTKRINN